MDRKYRDIDPDFKLSASAMDAPAEAPADDEPADDNSDFDI